LVPKIACCVFWLGQNASEEIFGTDLLPVKFHLDPVLTRLMRYTHCKQMVGTHRIYKTAGLMFDIDMNGNMGQTWDAFCKSSKRTTANFLHSAMSSLSHESSILFFTVLFPRVEARPTYHYNPQYWPFLTYFVILIFYVATVSLLIDCTTLTWRENVSGLKILSFFIGALLMSNFLPFIFLIDLTFCEQNWGKEYNCREMLTRIQA
jgi:hypothetical protein